MNRASQQRDVPRRGFLYTISALVAAGLAAVFPVGAAVALVFDPLRRRDSTGGREGFLRVAPLGAIPADGVPRVFPVVSTPVDAWNRYAEQPIGSVYLRRAAESDEVTALSATCPHAGCFVDFRGAKDRFVCPCHDSQFEPDGARIDPKRCPSPRDLDPLETEIRDGIVWVKYLRFRPATSERIVEA